MSLHIYWDLLDLGRMDVKYSFYGASHWQAKRSSESTAVSPIFEKCCKKGDVRLPPVREPPEYLRCIFLFFFLLVLY